MAAARRVVLTPKSSVRTPPQKQEQLLLILRGAVRVQPTALAPTPPAAPIRNGISVPHTACGPENSHMQPESDRQHLTQGSFDQPHMHAQTGSEQQQAQTTVSMLSHGPPHGAASAESHGSSYGQPHDSLSAAPQQPASADKLDQLSDRYILDARGCAFGLPGLLQGSALAADVVSETVVEAYSIPWSLIQVIHLHHCHIKMGQVNHSLTQHAYEQVHKQL